MADDGVEDQKAVLKRLKRAYKASRLDYERSITAAKTRVHTSYFGERISRVGATSLTTWTVFVAHTHLDVAGLTAEVESTSDEKAPVRLAIKDQQGRQHSAGYPENKRSEVEAFARRLIDQSHWAADRLDEREAAVTASMTALQEAIADGDRVRVAADEYAVAAEIDRSTSIPPFTLTANQVMDTAPNKLLQSSTDWLPGGSPTVRAQRKVFFGGLAALILVVLIGLIIFVNSSSPSSSSSDRQATSSERRSSDSNESSRGSVTVPNVSGKSLNQAVGEIRAAGLGTVPTDCSGQNRSVLRHSNWYVQRQTPSGGARAPAGSEVTLCSLKHED